MNPRITARLTSFTALGLSAMLLVSGCSLPEDSPDEPLLPSGPAAKGTALAALQKLPVKGRAPMTDYDREQFGSAWSDAVGKFSWSRNGCDTRNDTLARDLVDVTFKPGSNDCDVQTGTLKLDPYSGEQDYYFDSLDDDYATDLDIEHIVALGNAWATGAQQLSEEKRAELANDPINLMAANPSLNRSKGDADFATWLPPNKSFRCSYAARQIRVKTVYGLWVTKPEKEAMLRVLATCPDEPLNQPDPQAPRGKKASLAEVPKDKPKVEKPTKDTSKVVKPEVKKPEVKKPRKPKPGNKTDKRFDTCTALHDAGFDGNYKRGRDPEYAWYRDSDSDGMVCES